MEDSDHIMDQDDTAYGHHRLSPGDKLMIIITLLIIVTSVISILIIMDKVKETVLLRTMAGVALLDSTLISVIVIRNNRKTKAVQSLNKIYLTNGINPNADRIFINKKVFVIGRLSDKTDFSPKDPTISKLHAEILKKHSKYYIMDLKSTNGTYLNGSILKSNKKYRITNGDTIDIGNYRCIFITKE